MSHNVLLCKEMDANLSDISKGGNSFHKTAKLIFWKIHLSNIACHDATRANAKPGEKHKHLLGGGILRLIKNNERVAEGAAAHIGQRGDLDDIPIHQLLEFLRFEEIMKGIVKWSKIREDFFLEVAREEAEGLARFDGGAGEDDPLDLVLLEGGNGTGDSEVGLSGSGGAHAESDIVGVDALQVGFLA
jgi:hypothetical protein